MSPSHSPRLREEGRAPRPWTESPLTTQNRSRHFGLSSVDLGNGIMRRGLSGDGIMRRGLSGNGIMRRWLRYQNYEAEVEGEWYHEAVAEIRLKH